MRVPLCKTDNLHSSFFFLSLKKKKKKIFLQSVHYKLIIMSPVDANNLCFSTLKVSTHERASPCDKPGLEVFT